MSTATSGNSELLAALDNLFAKYFNEKDESVKEKTPEDKFWGVYLRSMKEEDEALPKDWDGDTGSILTFTGLFAATVAAFIIESYKQLSRDSGDETVVLLTQLLAATTDSTSSPAISSTSATAFSASPTAVIANALWFCSLVIALACALLATLVQQWSRDYVRAINNRGLAVEGHLAPRALNHAYIRTGVERYGLDGVVNIIVALVHLAVIIFAAGLLVFLFPINIVVSWCTTCALAILGMAYLIAGILPIFDKSCPYRTPLTFPFNIVYAVLKYSLGTCIWFLKSSRLKSIPMWMFRILSKINGRIQPDNRRLSDIPPHFRSTLGRWWPEGHVPGVGVPRVDNQDRLFSGAPYTVAAPVSHRLDISRPILMLETSIDVFLRRLWKPLSKGTAWMLWNGEYHYKPHLWLPSSRSTRENPSYQVLASISCFALVWTRVGSQMLRGDATLRNLFFQSIVRVLQEIEGDGRTAVMQYLLTNSTFAVELLARKVLSLDTDARVAKLKIACIVIQMFYTTEKEVWKPSWFDSSRDHRLKNCLWGIFSISYISQIDRDRDHAPFALQEFLVLFHLRWFLLSESWPDLRNSGISWSITRLDTMYFSKGARDSNNSRWGLLYNHELLEHPLALLLLLNSQLYNPIKGIDFSPIESDQEKDDADSCLVPLHNSTCCSERDGPLEHIAACTILTMIAALLRAPDQERYDLIDVHVRDYGGLWDHGLTFATWETRFKMDDNARLTAPSQAFLTVLHEAGLQEWLKPGNGTAYLPPSDTPLGQFLAMPIEKMSYNGIGPQPPSTTFADLLRTLTRFVDLSDIHTGLPEEYRWLLQSSDALPSVFPDTDIDGGLPIPKRNGGEVLLNDASGYSHGLDYDPMPPERRIGGLSLEKVVIHSAVGGLSQRDIF